MSLNCCEVKIYNTTIDLTNAIARWKSDNPTGKIGFVPTMGALHDGHMTLVEAAKKESDFVIVSVFVNPTQFNDAEDLKRYPRTEEADAKLLVDHHCDVLFLPSVEDMYPPTDTTYDIHLNGLDKVMEGKYRKGHFEGVCNIVEKLLRIVTPDLAFFGIKDFQQVAIISHMVNLRKLPVKIVACPIKRSDSGLALSSRNALLNWEEKEAARIINWTLRLGKQLVSEGKDLSIVKENMLALFNTGQLTLEYLEIVDNISLKSLDKSQPKMSACMAAYCGNVRLIDNIQLN